MTNQTSSDDLPHVVHVLSSEEAQRLRDGVAGELGEALLELEAEGRVTLLVRGKPGENPTPFRIGEQ